MVADRQKSPTIIRKSRNVQPKRQQPEQLYDDNMKMEITR